MQRVQTPALFTASEGEGAYHHFLPGKAFCVVQSIGIGEQTLSAKFASAPQVKQVTVGLSLT